MRKEWFFDRFCGEQIAIYAEDGKIVEVSVENDGKRDLIGMICKGVVCNVVAGMQAAFISCGLEKNAYLPLDENLFAFSSYDGEGRAQAPISLKEGDEVLVQVVKPPLGAKGAKVTTSLSFVGKRIIYLPHTDFLGISRKITDEETRARLLDEALSLKKEGEGFIMRTVAESAGSKQFQIEADYLRQVFRSVQEAAEGAPVGAVLYRDQDLASKVARDSLGDDVSNIYVGDRELYERVLALIRLRTDISEDKLILYEGQRSLVREYGLDNQIYDLASARVEIGNGANLVIDHTEAMTVIDVNTGKFVGGDDLESTVFRTNLLAAREIARQVRLRNMGGIFAVDFIDMAEEEHRNAVFAELECCLMQDRAKCRLQPMSDLCVVLFTRKRTIHEVSNFLLKPCPHCTREGYVLSDIYMAMRIRTEMMELFHEGYDGVVIELNYDLANAIAEERVFAKEMKGRWKEKRVFLIPHKTYHQEKFTVKGFYGNPPSLPEIAKEL